MAKTSRKSNGSAEIQWRIAPKNVDSETRPKDANWSHHSWCPHDQAESEIVHLTNCQSENGLFEFRIRP